MVRVDLLNEKGNVKATERSLIREQVVDYLKSHTNFNITPNDTMYMQVCETADGSPVYAVIDLSISIADPTVKKIKKSSDKEQEEKTIPQLF